MKTLVLGAMVLATALFSPAAPHDTGGDRQPEARQMVVLLPRRDNCTCKMQENVSETLPSPTTCQIPNTDPPQFQACYTKTVTNINPPPAFPDGYCHVESCPDTAQPCHYRGFNITVNAQGNCVPGTFCCATAKVKKDNVLQNTLAPGGAVGPIPCDPGTVSCNNHPTNTITVECNGVIIYRIVATFDSNNCLAAGG